ncbi:MAG TPA: hypothetical protein VGC99_11405, partial [Candidatus Tectomicrobia bacterium]
WVGLLGSLLGRSHASIAVEVPASAKLSVEATIGFRETIKIGKWLPVTVTIRNDGTPVRGLLALELSTVSEGYPQPYITTLSQAVDLPTQSRKRYSFVVMFRDFTHPLVIRLTDQSGLTVYTREIDLRTLTSPDRLILAFSNEPVLDSLAGVSPGKARVVYQNLDELPGRWDALDAVDLIALRNLSLAPLRPEQMQALQQWVARGGYLLVTGGPNWTHYTHPYWRELIPLTVTGMVEVTTLQPLEPLVGVSSPEDIRLSILHTEAINGNILARTDEHALLIAQKRGRGEVVFVAFDPGRAPLTAWDGMTMLWRALFRLDETPNYWKLRRELRETFDETWIAQALQLPLLSFPSHLLLAVFLVLYASTIGFFFWRVGLESRTAGETWMLIGLTLIAFSGGAHLLFREPHIQQDALLFEVSAVDVIPQSRFADIETHLALLSTRKHMYDLKIAGQPSTWLQIVPPMTRDLQLDWHLQQDQVLTMKDILVPGWGMRVFKGRGLQEFPIGTRVLREADTVMVRVTNKSGYVLQHCWLWRGPRIVPLGTLDDGDEAEGVLTVSPDDLSRGVQQVRWERDLAHEMFKGRELPDLLRRAVVERSMQEMLRSDPTWQKQVIVIGWLERPLTVISVGPGNVGVQRATMVRMRLPI